VGVEHWFVREPALAEGIASEVDVRAGVGGVDSKDYGSGCGGEGQEKRENAHRENDQSSAAHGGNLTLRCPLPFIKFALMDIAIVSGDNERECRR